MGNPFTSEPVATPFDIGLGLPDDSDEVLARMRQLILERKPPGVPMETFAVHCMFQILVIEEIHGGYYVTAGNLLARVLDLPMLSVPEHPPSRPESWVYFIQAGDSGDIKIGLARDVAKRMSDIQNGCPHELRLLVAVPGDKDVELAFHREFRQWRVRREWFAPSQELLDRIKVLAEAANG